MLKYTIACLFIIFYSLGYSQNILVLENGEVFKKKIGSTQYTQGSSEKIDNPEGRFLNEEFEDGSFTYANETFEVPLRYNIYDDIIEFEHENGIFEINFRKSVLVNLRDYNFVHIPMTEFGIVDVIFESEYAKIVRKLKVDFEAGREAKDSYVKERKGHFNRKKDEIYLIYKNNVYELKKKKQFAKEFNQGKIEDFLKDEKIDFEKTIDLQKLGVFVSKL